MGALALGLALLASGCIVGEEDDRRDPTTLHVSLDGDDAAGDGSAARPFRTVTGAVARAIAGDTIAVQPGAYETECVINPGNDSEICDHDQFPIRLLPRMTVIGNPDGHGADTILRSNTVRPMFICAQDARITGLTLDNLDSEEAVINCSSAFESDGASSVTGFVVTRNTIQGTGAASGYGILDAGDGTEIRDNRFSGHFIGIETNTNAMIRDNVVQNATEGIRVVYGAALLEGNTLSFNTIGLVIAGREFEANPDLGGGALGSVGGNTLSCNTGADIQNFNFSRPVHAAGNYWDHAPPEEATVAQTMPFPGLPAGTTFSQDILGNRGPEAQFTPMITDDAETVTAPCEPP